MKIKWKRNLSVAVSTLLLSSISYAGVENTIKLVVRSYMSNDENILPLLITSKDQGANWSYAPDISSRSILPADFTDEEIGAPNSNNALISASCQKNFCITAGRYKTPSGIFVPLIGLSENLGNSWAYNSIKPEDYAKETEWFFDPIKTVCNKKTCLIAMPYINNKNIASYSFMTTQNQGQSWLYSTLSNLPERNNISSLDGSGANFVGTGYSVSKSIEDSSDKGFIILSKDQGQSWSLPTLNFPDQYKKPVLEAVKCNKNICIAKGYDSAIKKLILLRSMDGGESWSIIPNEHHVTGTKYNGDDEITCTDHTWAIASTSVVDKEGGVEWHPFVLVSQDDGKTWDQPSDIISKLPDELAQTNHTNSKSISCFGNNCILTTSTFLRYTMTPALAISHDKGISWSYINVSPPDLGSFGASLSYLSCDEKSCVILGGYSTKQNDHKPFLLTSNDGGKSWYTPTLNTPENIWISFTGGTNASQIRAKQNDIKIKHEKILKLER